MGHSKNHLLAPRSLLARWTLLAERSTHVFMFAYSKCGHCCCTAHGVALVPEGPELEKDHHWQRIVQEWYAKVDTLTQDSLARVSRTIIWEFSVARRKVMSYMRFITLSTTSRGKAVCFK